MSEQTVIVVTDGDVPIPQAEELTGNLMLRDTQDNQIRIVNGNNPDRLRGYSADLVVLLTDKMSDTMDNIIRPMVAVSDGTIVEV